MIKPPGVLSRLFSSAPARDSAAPRMLAYCASNVGAGPMMRLVRVIEQLKTQRPEISILLVTDAADTTRAEAAGAAIVRLPRFEYFDAEQFKERPAMLQLRNQELARLRAGIILAAGRNFAPDLIFADTNPHGKRDELLPQLRHARARKIKIVLMMRDIPAAENETFKLRGDETAILKHARYYDSILVAGDANFFDVAEAYNWPQELRKKLSYAGFFVPQQSNITRDAALAPWPQIDQSLPLVVASCGGGWQAETMVPALLRGIRLFRDQNATRAQLVIFTGPAANQPQIESWRAEATALGGTAVERFSPNFDAALEHAELAMIQAGSTVFQILDSEKIMVLLTRPFKTDEQLERAQRLAKWPGLRQESMVSLTPEHVAEWLRWGLGQKIASRQTGYAFAGQTTAANFLINALKH